MMLSYLIHILARLVLGYLGRLASSSRLLRGYITLPSTVVVFVVFTMCLNVELCPGSNKIPTNIHS